MIVLDKISLWYGTRALFDEVTLSFARDQRVGVIGRNGAGKSTLLKVIAGQIPVDGQIRIPKTYRVAYMPQEVVLQSTDTVIDQAMRVFEQLMQAQQRCLQLEQELERQPADAQRLLDEYTALQNQCALFDHSAALARAQYILKGLGFSQQRIDQPVNQLSVGWKMRLILAQLLLQDADFYLFDEPTNHLDLPTKEWFAQFLRTASFGFLLVTHDRYFLDNHCDWTLDIDRGKATLYRGTYSAYQVHQEQQRRVMSATAARQEREIARKQATIDRFRASSSKAKMAQSMIKQLGKMERVEVEPPPPTIHFSFPPLERSGAVVLTVKDVQHSFEQTVLFRNVSFEVQRGMRLAVVAPNGTGKTTLFNLLLGRYALQEGSVTFGHKVTTAFFEQDQAQALTATNDILTEVSSACSRSSEVVVRSFLGSFLFSGQDVYKKIAMLSGGERNRVAMVKVLLQAANFLILDEPTNHLDIASQEVLLRALQAYEGTILFVSHDQRFIQNLATHILELTPEGAYTFSGTYEDYKAARKDAESSQQQSHARTVSLPLSVVKNPPISHDTRKQLNKLEREIASLEKEKERLAQLFAQYDYGTVQYHATLTHYQRIERELSDKMSQWEAIAV